MSIYFSGGLIMKRPDFRSEIINYIKRNRVSSTEVADCLGKTGAINGVRSLNRGHFKVGKVFWTYAHDESNWDMHKQLQCVREDDVVLVDVFECNDRAIFGDLVTKFLVLYKQASAVVVKGNIRDVHRLVKENWPVWCQGFSPIGCFNAPAKNKLDKSVIKSYGQKYNNSIAVCDDTGVVVIPKERHNNEFLEKLELIEKQEDIWYECIDRRKWTTFETVCLKKYLKN